MKREDELAIMKSTAIEAGETLRYTQERTVKTTISRRDFTTNADKESETYIREELGEYFPKASFYGEELGGTITNGDLFIIDPVDGTNNFFYGDDWWGVSIALVRDGKTEQGVVYLPGKDLFFWADVRKAVAHMECRVSEVRPFNRGTYPKVSKERELKRSRVWTDWTKKGPKATLEILKRLDRATVLPQIRCCCTANMMAVATGKIDGYVHPGPQPFDIAAACLIVEKSGGKVTDLKGNPWTPFSDSIVATNGRIHKGLLSALKRKSN